MHYNFNLEKILKKNTELNIAKDLIQSTVSYRHPSHAKKNFLSISKPKIAHFQRHIPFLMEAYNLKRKSLSCNYLGK